MKQRKSNSKGRSLKGGRTQSEGNMVKAPEQWKTGDEPMTGAQRSYIETLSGEAGVEPKKDLTKAEAARKIDELQRKTGRGETSDR
jgi:hypothetical protein